MAKKDSATAAKRAAADRKAAEVAGREKLLADAADPGGDHPNVLVVKSNERAAKAEQRRLDEGAAAAARQSSALITPVPPTTGTLPAEFVPAHPLEPDATGSAPHSPSTPAGPMGEDVIHRTDDIAPDGTPLVRPTMAPDLPHIDGESDRDLNDLNWRHSPAENDPDAPAAINSHSPEGAALDAIKLGRPVEYVPNDATLDPVSGNPGRAA